MTNTTARSSSKRHIFIPLPGNQSGSKRLIVESMAPVGINTDVTGVVYAPAPGDTRPEFVTVRFVAQVTEGTQPNSKKAWASHPMGCFEAAALPDIGIFTISGVTNAEMARLPFGGAGYHIGALVRGVNMVETRLNESSDCKSTCTGDAHNCRGGAEPKQGQEGDTAREAGKVAINCMKLMARFQKERDLLYSGDHIDDG